MSLALLISTFTLSLWRMSNRRSWHTSNHIISERILLILWCGECVEETTAHVLTALATGIEFRNIVLRCFRQIVTAHVLLVHNIGLEGLLTGTLRTIVTYEHDFNILLVWMWVALARGVGVCISADFYLFDTGMSADFG